ncbi:uncharacterized protein LOC134719876 isoform X1 [Mytilus trossulus]|uniref:uncharacterized protein LOC134719876 isoform X1 n=1 Tax=Mytilus trossulus TaxID=6551 RepID=UPI003004271F
MSVSCVLSVYVLGFVTTNLWIISLACNILVFLSEYLVLSLTSLQVTVLIVCVILWYISTPTFLISDKIMGNETSSIPSDVTTPTSDIQESVVSFGSKRRASVSSTRLPSPVEPPEPDLSDLTEEEISQIRSVIGRAKEMQKAEEKRIRHLEEDYLNTAMTVEELTIAAEPEASDIMLCPVCLRNELKLDDKNPRKWQHVCVDCQNMTCSECGKFESSLNTKLQEWVCTVCQKRRMLVLSTGLWHPGVEVSDTVPLEREIQSRLEMFKNSRPPLERSISADRVEVSPTEHHKGFRKLRRQISLPDPIVSHANPGKHLGSIAESGKSHQGSQEHIPRKDTKSSAQSLDSPDSCDVQSTSSGTSRIKGVLRTMAGSCGMKQKTQSDSELSDITSDVDMEDVSMQYYQGDGVDTDDVSDDYSMMSIGSSDDSRLYRKHRPLSLNLNQSQSATSSDDDTSDSALSTDTENRLAPFASLENARVALAASAFAEEMRDFKGESSEESWNHTEKSDSEVHSDNNKCSPHAPRSPSWREGLDSPPFSPRRRDSYPGKKRNVSSPASSPKENQFNFTEITAPPGQFANFEQQNKTLGQLKQNEYFGSGYSADSGSNSPEDQLITDSSDDEFIFARRGDEIIFSNHREKIGIPQSAAVMDLASFAASIANDTANLTQMTISPTNLDAYSMGDNYRLSPDSQDSTGSSSPGSPGIYDNPVIPEEPIELADPSSKPIDYQGSRRQKARPPSTDWSPVIDLSPILDVSPSVEEAEQVDMLEKQEEERRRRESQEEDEDEATDKPFFKPINEEEDSLAYYGLKRYERVEDICKLVQNNNVVNSEQLEHCVKENLDQDAKMKEVISEIPFSCVSRTDSTVQQGSVVTSSPAVSCALVDSKMSSETKDPYRTVYIQPTQNMSTDVPIKQIVSPTPKQRRKLPEPTPEMVSESRKKKPLPPLPIDAIKAKTSPKRVIDTKTLAENKVIDANTTSVKKEVGVHLKITRSSSLDEPPKKPEKVSTIETNSDYNQPVDVRKMVEKRSSSLESHKFNPNISAVDDVIEPLKPISQLDLHKSDNTRRMKHITKSDDKINKISDRSSENSLQRQESEERRLKTKHLKAKPNPLLIQHIEAEECNVSPSYRVLDSPPSPESRSSLKRDYSDSTSVSPSSSPDRDLYMYPSPVTPPDSDSSPPKPHSPSSPGTDFDDDNFIINKITPTSVKEWHKEVSHTKVKDKVKTFEQISAADQKKGRRKLPPIPVTEEIPSRTKGQNNVHKKQHLKQDHKRKPRGYATPSSTSDESMNEDDIEVAMFTRHRKNMNNLDKPTLDKWNGNYLPSEVSYSDKNIKELYNEDIKANIPAIACAGEKVTNVERNIDQYLKDKDETDAIIDSMINIYGAPITQAMKSLKKRLQDELRRVTEGRRTRIEELEEIRALQMQIGELKLSREYAKLQAKRTLSPKTSKQPTNQNGKKRVPTSPQVAPRKSRHKRQSSDPMISKFSPIKEDKDIEGDMQIKGKDHKEASLLRLVADDSSLSGLSDTDSTRSEPIMVARQQKIATHTKTFVQSKESTKYQGRDVYSKVLRPDMKPKSHSETHIPELVQNKPALLDLSDDEERKAREQRKQQLQNEIERRKRQLEETSKLQNELFQLTRSGQVMAHSYDDIPKKSTNMYAIMRPIPTGIIKPLDDDYSDEDKDSQQGRWETETSYSSSEYLAHKQERTKRSRGPDLSAHSSPYIYQGNVEDKKEVRPGKQKVDFYLRPHHGNDLSMHSSVTLPELHTKQVEYASATGGAFSDTEASPPSDSTPAMPLLDDVKARSRKIIHEIGTGSRPVSAEYNLTSDDLLNGMHRVESDNSVDADEPLMKHKLEGGVTILKQKDRKKQPAPAPRKKYDFGIKRILLTRDPKDKSIKAGNGIGMKIVGGKTVKGTTESGAFVTAIFPGGVADQLHGELKEGDQILEWNGIELSNKTYKDVQRIINVPNVEIELVVKPSAHHAKAIDKTKGGRNAAYDNMEYVADEVYEKCLKSNQGVDPKQLAAQLEGIREGDSLTGSQPESQSSSQHDEYVTPSLSSPSNSSQTSTSSDRNRSKELREIKKEMKELKDAKANLNAEKGIQNVCGTMGEIQLQLSHDDYDNTLNVHLIQARNLMPKDINGLSDPFVKIYLLPGRCLENKRRSKHISRTLNPQWHQTVMFQDLHREELQNKMLEITVWDYDRFKTNDFLGEVIIDLSVNGVMDNMPHWYLLREHDVTTGVELPKPTLLPADIRGASDMKLCPSPNLYCNSQGSPKPNRQKLPTSKSEGMGRRRRSLGTLTDTDRLSASDSTDVSSAHSSPLLRHNSNDMPLTAALTTSHPGV